jgi:hypothetical protein
VRALHRNARPSRFGANVLRRHASPFNKSVIDSVGFAGYGIYGTSFPGALQANCSLVGLALATLPGDSSAAREAQIPGVL